MPIIKVTCDSPPFDFEIEMTKADILRMVSYSKAVAPREDDKRMTDAEALDFLFTHMLAEHMRAVGRWEEDMKIAKAQSKSKPLKMKRVAKM